MRGHYFTNHRPFKTIIEYNNKVTQDVFLRQEIIIEILCKIKKKQINKKAFWIILQTCKINNKQNKMKEIKLVPVKYDFIFKT